MENSGRAPLTAMVRCVPFVSSVCRMAWAVVCAVMLQACVHPGDSGIVDGGDRTHAVAMGEAFVSVSGPNPRQFPPRVRFFDVVDTKTSEWHRVTVQPKTHMFHQMLPPGEYRVTRLQIAEGPFLMEAYVTMRFSLLSGRRHDLGRWNVVIDTPRTQRMLRVEMMPREEDDESHAAPGHEATPLTYEKTLPQYTKSESRLYVVAPAPKVKYFYRR